MISYIASLFLMSNVLLLVQSACTEGFMDLSLLERKAADPHSSLSTLAEDGKATRWIITDANNRFTCDNVTITEFLIGVDIRTRHSMRMQYPSIEVWYEYENSHYKRYHFIKIELSPENFTTNGIYRYFLHEPITVLSGYMLGVHQPKGKKSVVRFYTARANKNTRVGKIEQGKVYLNNYPSISSMDIDESNRTDIIMIYPITGQY